MTERKTKLLEYLLKYSAKNGSELASAESFLRAVALYVEYGTKFYPVDDLDVREERAELTQLLISNNIDPMGAAVTIGEFLVFSHIDQSDALAFRLLISRLEFSCAGELTAVKVCERVLEHPTWLITRASRIKFADLKKRLEVRRKTNVADPGVDDLLDYIGDEDGFAESEENFTADPSESVLFGDGSAKDGEEWDEDEDGDSDGTPMPGETEEEFKRRMTAFHAFLEDTGLFDDDEDESPTPDEKSKKVQDISSILGDVERVRSALFDVVYGQDHAVSEFVNGFFRAELSAAIIKNRDKPRATFLFAGAPGVGKTFLAEQAAKALGLPFMRFDMSEYTDKESNLEFCGSDKVYKNGAEGNVTGFVKRNPHCILLFDEVEKAHLSIIYLLLQMLDAGRLRDNHTDEEVSFTDAIIIFTTNVGKRMYEDESINLLTVSRKSILKSLSTELNPFTGEPKFPAAICSRFASGNVVMFNRLGADYLIKIADRELKRHLDAFCESMGVKVNVNPLISYALLFSEGGKADARTIKGRCSAFVYGELYELYRFIMSVPGADANKIKKIDTALDFSGDGEIQKLFKKRAKPTVLLFCDKSVAEAVRIKLGNFRVLATSDVEEAKLLMREHDISIILCDVKCGTAKYADVLNAADAASDGMEFFGHALAFPRIPLYVLDGSGLKKEEAESLTSSGARGVLSPYVSGRELIKRINAICDAEHVKANLSRLARSNKVLTFGTSQKISKDGTGATITLYGFKMRAAIDAEDNQGVVNDVDRPKVRFSDVIGAKDAKDELKYFVNYLKNPAAYAVGGLKPPKGLLLYGPPGTGKTLLARATAGESDVTFIKTEGNRFLKKYVGEGSEAVHDLFATARKYAPSILFIDEIDAIAKKRGSEDTATTGDILTSFLTEMDGFDADVERPVFVLAATNFDVEGDALDPALLRRFDRRIYVDLPDKNERLQFIKFKVGKIKSHSLTKSQLENLAVRSTGASLADLDSVFELALRSAVRSKKGKITDEILEDAFETFNGGEVRKWSGDELLRTARHEAGHAVVCWASGEKPTYLTIVARGSHGGYMQHADSSDKGVFTKNELLARVRACLGGRAAEVEYYGEEDGLSSGASGDLQSATYIVKEMVCKYGMDEKSGLCTINLSELSGEKYDAIFARINENLLREFEAAKKIIAENRAAVDALSAKLLECNALKESQISAILKRTFKKV